MLRISCTTAAQITTIHLAGKLLSPWCEELRAAMTAVQSSGLARLDLSELSFADATGVELLHEFQVLGIEIVGNSGFMEGLLAQPSSAAN